MTHAPPGHTQPQKARPRIREERRAKCYMKLLQPQIKDLLPDLTVEKALAARLVAKSRVMVTEPPIPSI